MFVKSRELEEFIDSLKDFWKLFKKHPFLTIFGAILSYVVIVALLILLP